MKRNAYLLAALAALLALTPGSAAASQVQPIEIVACPGEAGCSNTSTVRVEEQFGLGVELKVTNSLSTGGSFFVEGPPGTDFVAPINVQLNYDNGGRSTPARR